jgi:PhoH-like ATPase
VEAEDYKSDTIGVDEPHRGRHTLEISNEEIDFFYEHKYLKIHLPENVLENDYVLMRSYDNSSALGMVKGGFIEPLKFLNAKPYDITPRNVGQKFAIDALMRSSDEIPLVILKGPAGTAKTFLSLAVGLEKVLNASFDEREYRKILITRGNVKMDNDIGYLKGDEKEKVMPLLRSFTDNLEQLVDAKNEMVQSKTEYLFDTGTVEVQALAYMRGRNLTNVYVIVDEAQNLTPNQVLSIVTRIGIGSKIVLIGDPDQIDNMYLDKHNNGLVYASEKMKGDPLCAQVTFEAEECTRSEIAMVASEKLSTKGIYKKLLFKNNF